MDVGLSAEVADDVGSFDLPDVPDLVVADVLFLVEGHVEVFEAAGLDILHRFVGISLAEGGQEVAEDLLDLPLLVAAEVAHTDAVETCFFSGKFDGFVPVFAPTGVAEGLLALFAIEHVVNFVGLDRLIPIGVILVIGLLGGALGGVSVDNGATKGGAFYRVSIAPTGAVATCEDELKFPRSRFAEKGDG